MTAEGLPARAFMSIGEVLGQLRQDFPDITISKIRFLEAEGLVEPERTASGYRKFSREDVGRLRFVLSAQRDQYLPLRVIKEQLEGLDRGDAPPLRSASAPAGAAEAPAAAPAASARPRALVMAEAMPGPEAFAPDATEVRLSRAELLTAAGLDDSQLEQLEQYGLLSRRTGASHYDSDALVIAKTVAEMARFGIEARHLRPFKAAADREIGLVEQVVTPLVRQRNPESRARADEVVRELAALSVKLHSTLVRQGLGPGLRR
jgi:DNA-binding transcriptional MerR regulator